MKEKPSSAKRENRVRLPTQRVKKTTVEKLARLKLHPAHKGIGKAIDFCVEGAPEK